ncbi:hydroxyisourate hydrolase [Brachybacterium horti]|uniref:hydroxyisourate hydrolase n=1 Tax=Brachybacterium sp. SGAir0954 TaxID=2571029 RepID=UPI001F114863
MLDSGTGRPAAGVAVSLRGPDGGEIASAATDADGRIGDLGPDRLPAGTASLRFDTGAYFAARGQETFYPEVVVAFRIDEEQGHLHVPLLLSPFAYSTYRGS